MIVLDVTFHKIYDRGLTRKLTVLEKDLVVPTV